MLQAALLAAGGGGLLDVNIPTLFWTWLVFGVTFWCLTKTAWPMLAAKMEEREIRIREGLDKAEEAERNAAALLEKQEAVLAEARDEAKKLLAESLAAAENVKNQTVEAAKQEIATERERARKEIDLERRKALDEIKRVAVDLTLEAAGHVLQRQITGEDDRRLAAEVIYKADVLK